MYRGEGTQNPVDMAYTRNYVQFALRNLSIKIPIKRKKSLLLGVISFFETTILELVRSQKQHEKTA